jgi:hypothetical protein
MITCDLCGLSYRESETTYVTPDSEISIVFVDGNVEDTCETILVADICCSCKQVIIRKAKQAVTDLPWKK